ncbi:hypothetical protein [Acidovorax sp. sic0104]|uniref:hypothetical protein n=1 Tax=Acidovorax sp. sic0104 TaxID=2854784 RepID=UPI001C448A03|nr:hypothetical protein [Acidovorax sp. sic0104]MBV7542177.1 hypothetical protein [Acidovorax sp. sic0104]
MDAKRIKGAIPTCWYIAEHITLEHLGMNIHLVKRLGIMSCLISGSLCPLQAQTVRPESSSLSSAAPFGVEIGKTTCRQAASALKPTSNKLLRLDSIPASAQLIPAGYPGASLFYVSCDGGGDAPVTYGSLSIFGGDEQYATVVSDLATKYKKNGPIESGGMNGLEFQTSNGNVIVYTQKTYQPAPRELMIEVRYNSLDAIEKDKKFKQKNINESRDKEQARRNVL